MKQELFTLGIDIGGSTTKIVALDGAGELRDTLQVRAADQLTSLYGAIGRMLSQNGWALSQISRIALTGVGASWADGDVYDIPTVRVAEFEAIGRGALMLAGLREALIVSMGTGTAFVRASLDAGCAHIGGSGVGGGTLLGLAGRLFNLHNAESVIELAKGGDLEMVDLTIREITRQEIPSLPPHATAANFGNVKPTASDADFALGLLNMIFQTAGMLAAFACADSPVRDVVVTGSMATLPQAAVMLSEVGALSGLRFQIPGNPAFATALGAAVLGQTRQAEPAG